ncbi:GNAT family N-acetyltransferase [Streptomyces aurantiacus]|uniref:Putative N-acetyltransferase in mutA 5'region n=1 Tax=Streptomyces aurantiacus JA 4570 TaxID=1286094 RepID=S3ZRW3_9ACTN|nr:GNAT family N-acetyltransferase [Streptomyces aurantiacus]EPH45554.1 putative N-acetyltransferase in mutA 5'region [Streptomyces aurantiacus JA 4570]
MIPLQRHQLPALSRWFTAAAPGTAALPEHVLAHGAGQWWADRAVTPRALAVSCAGHVLLRGDPRAVSPCGLAPFAAHHVEAPPRFLPVLGAAFDRIVPAERMAYVHREHVDAPRPPRGVRVRRVSGDDAAAFAALWADSEWLHASWGGAAALAASGHAVAAFDRGGRAVSVACSYFAGEAYEDVAVATAPEHRRKGLAHACVAALTADIAARGRTASWSCARDNRPSRLLAWTAGFRLEHEYTHYVTGAPRAAEAAPGQTAPPQAPAPAQPPVHAHAPATKAPSPHRAPIPAKPHP